MDAFNRHKLNDSMKALGVSTSQLARRFNDPGALGFSNRRNLVGWWRSGRKTPSPYNVTRLASLLGVTVDSLVD